MIVSIHLESQSQPIEFTDVKNTYTKDGLYCIYTNEGVVHKFPIMNLFRTIESYKK